jgi:ribosomal protein L29
MTKMTDIKKMKDEELTKLVSDKREVVRTFRFGTGGKNVGDLRGARKEVARALTELKSRATKTVTE